MSKAVLISIRPKWVEKIANGEKTIEVRKTKPKLETPFKCYIYCTLPKYPHEDFIATDYPMPQFYGGGKVIGEFVCDCVTPLYNVCMDDWKRLAGGLHNIEKELVNQACLTEAKLHTYAGGKNCFAWHISNLKIYDAPKKLGDFWRDCPEYSELSTNCWSCENVCGDGNETDCNTDGRLYLHRPPQSWCYVDDVQAQ